MTGYELSKHWFNWCFNNTGKHSPAHTALYMWICEKWNRLGKKDNFGLSSGEAMEVIGISSKSTYYKVFNDLVAWEFINIVSESKNQFTATIISLNQNLAQHSNGKRTALDLALIQQVDEQLSSTVPIDKPITNNQETNNQEIAIIPFSDEVKKIGSEIAILFSISEMKNNDSFRKIFRFLTEIQKSSDLEYLKTQFSAYREFKKESKSPLHNLFSFIGYDKYNDFFDVMKGAWNECNWSEKLSKISNKPTSITTSRPLTEEDYK